MGGRGNAPTFHRSLFIVHCSRGPFLVFLVFLVYEFREISGVPGGACKSIVPSVLCSTNRRVVEWWSARLPSTAPPSPRPPGMTRGREEERENTPCTM